MSNIDYEFSILEIEKTSSDFLNTPKPMAQIANVKI